MYKLQSFRITYHDKKEPRQIYDFNLELFFKQISISRDELKQNRTTPERQIKEGFKYLVDKKENFVVDSLGQRIKVDNIVTAKSEFYEYT